MRNWWQRFLGFRKRTTPFWVPGPNFLAQSAHVGWGAFILLALTVLGVRPWLAWTCFLSGVVFKETFIDTWMEGTTLKEELGDVAFYSAGGLLGCWLTP